MKSKLTLLLIGLFYLMASISLTSAKTTGTVKFTDGLKKGDTLTYSIEIDKTFNPNGFTAFMKDGDEVTYE